MRISSLLRPSLFPSKYIHFLTRHPPQYAAVVCVRYFSKENDGKEESCRVKFTGSDNKPVKTKPKAQSSIDEVDSIPLASITEPSNEAGSAAIYVDAQQTAIFATKVGAFANVSLAISKGIIGLSISSTALVADSVNSMGDVVGDAVVYYTVKEARKRATPDRPWGLGKLEPLGALTVGSLLLLTGLGIGFHAFATVLEMCQIPSFNLLEYLNLLNNTPPDSSMVHGATGVKPVVGASEEVNRFAGVGIAGLSIVAKEALFRYTLSAGKKANSAAVIANAWQHRSDAIISAAVMAGLCGSMLGYPILDPAAGVLVAGVILNQAGIIIGDALKDLSDAPASEKETEALRKTCLAVKGVLRVTQLRARKSGPFLFVEVTVGVNGTISASAAHRLAQLSRLALLKNHEGRVANAVVHVTPLGSSGLGEQYPTWARDHDFIVAEIKRAVLPIKEILSVSEVQVYYKDDGKIATKVDILLSANLTIQEAHSIAVTARKAIEKTLPGISDIDVDLELEEGSTT